jgi:hypothetical protein
MVGFHPGNQAPALGTILPPAPSVGPLPTGRMHEQYHITNKGSLMTHENQSKPPCRDDLRLVLTIPAANTEVGSRPSNGLASKVYLLCSAPLVEHECHKLTLFLETSLPAIASPCSIICEYIPLLDIFALF